MLILKVYCLFKQALPHVEKHCNSNIDATLMNETVQYSFSQSQAQKVDPDRATVPLKSPCEA